MSASTTRGALIDEYIAHRWNAKHRCSPLRRDVPRSSPMDLVPTLYAGYPVEVYPLAAWTVQAHLDKLVRDGAIDRVEAGSNTDPPRYVAPIA